MAMGNARSLYLALIAAVGAALPLPAAAQFTEGRAAFAERPRAEQVQFRDFFRFPFGDDRGYGGYHPYSPYSPYSPFGQPRAPQAVEATKPPPPRKVETAPSSIALVIGDTFADWLGYGLEQTFADTPEIGIVRKIRPSSGLVRYDVRADAPDWSQAVKDMLATEKPSAIVIMLGVNDRLPLRERAPSSKTVPQGTEKAAPGSQGAAASPSAPNAAPADSEQSAATTSESPRRAPGGNYEFRTDVWAELYEKRIDEMIAAVKSKGVPVFWVGLPAIRGAKSTSDMNYLDELYRARAEKAGITYVDIWDGFVDERGQFTMQGPDFEGQTRRLRTYDGVNFTNVGAEKLAHYVEHELRKVLTAHVVPVALPGPEEPGSAKGNARPAIGPVVPLNAALGGQGGELLGATDHPAQHESDPVATQVLNRGDAITAPPGRADNFSWPRAETGSAVDTPPAVSPAPSLPPKGAAGKNDAGKGETKKSSNK